MNCERCGSSSSVSFSEAEQSALCEPCFLAGDPPLAPPQSKSVPRPSFLVPCPTTSSSEATPSEREVDALLRLHAAGDLDPEPVDLPELPAGATEGMRKIAGFFALVCGLRRAVCDDREVIWATRWVERHTGVPRTSISRINRALVDCGFFAPPGTLPARHGRRATKTYAPGPIDTAVVLPFRRKNTA